MPGQTVIDLSLSTDDEGPQASHRPLKAISAVKNDSDYRSVPDQSIDIDGGPRKRRKLSPPVLARPSVSESKLRPHVAGNMLSLPTMKATKQSLPFDDDDPILWTSSPKQKQPLRTKGGYEPASFPDSDSSLPDEQWLRTAQQRPAPSFAKRSQGSTSLDRDKNAPKKSVLSSRRKDKKSSNSEVTSQTQASEDDSTQETSKRPTARKPKLTEEEKATRAREKETARAAVKAVRAKEKEEDKERKRLLKEEQAREKQIEKDRVEANKLKLDKKLSTPEMIVDLPISIDGTTVDTQIREFLKQIGVEITSYQSPVSNTIKWRRKVESRLDADTGWREKLPAKEIDLEKHVMCLMSANELADLVVSDIETDGHGLNEHVARIKSAFTDCIPIYIIEGLDAWIRKNRNARNRAYAAAVLAQPTAGDQNSITNGKAATSKRKKQQTSIVDEDMIEDALLRLQVVHNCLIHHAAVPIETAEWVAHFTEQISQVPYRFVIISIPVQQYTLKANQHVRQEQMAREATFCMDSGQIKSGKDAEETYINMLLANVRVTAPIAYGIATKYPNVSALVRGLEGKGQMALESLKKSANRDGSVADRNIGPAISRRLYKVFTDRDPSSTDV
ncbi:MAG: hypothetical protein L6R39_004941 [Caloplaca ligustica]|nr:MAG: hypothetical protein L6R39_004941 [Caloplaca ligustica]